MRLSSFQKRIVDLLEGATGEKALCLLLAEMSKLHCGLVTAESRANYAERKRDELRSQRVADEDTYSKIEIVLDEISKDMVRRVKGEAFTAYSFGSVGKYLIFMKRFLENPDMKDGVVKVKAKNKGKDLSDVARRSEIGLTNFARVVWEERPIILTAEDVEAIGEMLGES